LLRYVTLRKITAVVPVNFLKPKVKVLFYSMLSDFFRNIIFFGGGGRFPDFSRLFIWWEKHVDEDEHGALVERY